MKASPTIVGVALIRVGRSALRMGPRPGRQTWTRTRPDNGRAVAALAFSGVAEALSAQCPESDCRNQSPYQTAASTAAAADGDKSH